MKHIVEKKIQNHDIRVDLVHHFFFTLFLFKIIFLNIKLLLYFIIFLNTPLFRTRNL